MKDNVLIQQGTAFQVPKHSFALSPSASGYTLKCSVDCKGADDADATWTDAPNGSVAANKVCVVNHIPAGMWFKCYGNTDDIYAIY